MGVMSCSRKGCENILCRRYSNKYGHICHDCFNELLETNTGVSIQDFMSSEKMEGIDLEGIKKLREEMLNSVFKLPEG